MASVREAELSSSPKHRHNSREAAGRMLRSIDVSGQEGVAGLADDAAVAFCPSDLLSSRDPSITTARLKERQS